MALEQTLTMAQLCLHTCEAGVRVQAQCGRFTLAVMLEAVEKAVKR